MAKRPFFEFILHMINLVFTVWGLGTLGYGLVCFFKWRQTLPKGIHRSLLAIDPPKESSETLPKALFIYAIIGIGAILLIVACLGYVGTTIRSPCCLLTYCVFLVPLIIVELGTALLIFFDHSWKKVIPKDINEDIIYNFLNDHWKIIRWISLGVFTLQVIALILAIYLRSVFNSAWYDNDEEQLIVYLPRRRNQNYNRLVAPTSTTTLPTSTTGVSVRANAGDSTKPTSPTTLPTSTTGVSVRANARDSTKSTSPATLPTSTTGVSVRANAGDSTKPTSPTTLPTSTTGVSVRANARDSTKSTSPTTLPTSTTDVSVRANARDSTKSTSPATLPTSTTGVSVRANARDSTKPASPSNTGDNVNAGDATNSTNNVE